MFIFIFITRSLQKKDMYVIVVYDVQVERLDTVRKYLKRYLNWMQNSVFEGDLTPSELVRIKVDLSRIVNKDKDCIIIYQVRSKDLLYTDVVGSPKSEPSTII
jgi:CRISPR-associated protein Cas2